MLVDLPESWLRVVGEELDQFYFHKLSAFVDDERRRAAGYPPGADVFTALKLTPMNRCASSCLARIPIMSRARRTACASRYDQASHRRRPSGTSSASCGTTSLVDSPATGV